MSFDNLSTRIGRNGASGRSGVYDRQIMKTMRLVGAFKTTTNTATAEQSFWPYGRSAHSAGTSSTASAIDLIRRDHLRRPDRRAALRCGGRRCFLIAHSFHFILRRTPRQPGTAKSN
jgi:hypothetical protein